MTVYTSPRVAAVVASSHRVSSRVEVWSRGRRVASVDVTTSGGSVSESWVSGIRRTLSLTVPASSSWDRWLAMPRLELRVYRGVVYGTTSAEFPFGVYPLPLPDRSDGPSYSISVPDRWQLIVDDNFPAPRRPIRGGIGDVAAALIRESTGLTATNDATDLSRVPSLLEPWSGSRDDTIRDLLDSIGAEAFFDAAGVPVIRDRDPQSSSLVLRDGDAGTVVSVSQAPQWAEVFNIIGVATSNPDASFPPVTVTIASPTHPAHPHQIGRRVMRYVSPLLTSPGQANRAGDVLLKKKSRLARLYKVTCSPNPEIVAGMRVQIVTAKFGTANCIVQDVTTPLGVGTQQVTAVAE